MQKVLKVSAIQMGKTEERRKAAFEKIYSENYFHGGVLPKHAKNPFRQTSSGDYLWPHTAAAFRFWVACEKYCEQKL